MIPNIEQGREGKTDKSEIWDQCDPFGCLLQLQWIITVTKLHLLS